MPKVDKTSNGFKVTKDEHDKKKEIVHNGQSTQHEKLDYIISLLEKRG